VFRVKIQFTNKQHPHSKIQRMQESKEWLASNSIKLPCIKYFSIGIDHKNQIFTCDHTLDERKVIFFSEMKKQTNILCIDKKSLTKT
jgi:hypothetical protein